MSAAPPDLPSMLSSLFSDPSALSGVASLLGGLLGGGEPSSTREEEPPGPLPVPEGESGAKPEAEEALPVMAIPSGEKPEKPELLKAGFPPHPKRGRDSKKRKQLLLALRPYLSRERCEMLETLVRVSDLAELLFPSRNK